MKFLITCFLFVALSSFAANPPYTAFKGAGGIVVTTNPPNGDIIIDGSSVVSSGTNSSMQVSTNNVAASTMASNINFTAGNNTVLKGTNIGSTAHINYGVESNLTFTTTAGVTWRLGSFGADSVTHGTDFGFWDVTTDELGFWFNASSEWQFNSRINAPDATFSLLPGSGDIVAVDGMGTTFRTNVASSAGTNIGVGQTLYLDLMGTDATAGRTNLVRTYRTPSNSVAAILSGDRLEVRGGAYPINPKADDAGEAANWNFNAGVAITNKNNFSIVGDKNAVWYMSAWRSNNSKFSAPMMRLENCTNVLIEGMTFIGLRTNAVVLSHGAFVLNNCSEVTFRNCTFSNWQNHAIVFQEDTTTFDVNSHLNFIGNTFANIGGTNHVTLQTDGVAIGAGGVNMDVIGNHFYNNLRDVEYCCDEDTRKVHIDLNTSEGCYFDSIMITGTNSSEVIVVNNIAKGYANFIVPGATADSSSWLKTYAGSNILVQGNLVSGFANGINSFPTVGTKTVDWRILNNTFVDFSGHAIAMPSVNSAMVGFDAIYERNAVKGNYFLNCTSAAVVINGNNSAVNDNTFIDCNLGGYFHGVVSIGWPTAGVAKNSTNISTVGNSLISSAANAGPAIAIYAMNYSNVVHGNEIGRNFATNIYNLGGGTRTRPVNLVAAGSLLRSDAAGDERAVTLGANMTWDGTTLNSTGGSGTPGGSTYSLQMNTNDTFFGDLLAQYFPYNSATEAGGYITMAVGGGSTTTNAMGANFFGAIGPHGFGLYTSNSARWLLPARGHFEPTTSNYLNVGSLLLPIGTNFHMSLQQHPNARNNRTMRSDDNGFGSWSPNPAGGSGFGPAGTFASMGGIQFAQTNELGDGMALDSTNLFRYDRASNEMIVTNTTSASNTVIGAGYIKTRLLEASNVNVSTLVVTNGIPAAGAEGNVQYNKGGVLGAEAAFTYDDSDDTLTVTSIVAQSMAILPNAGAGKVLTSDANGVGSWAAPAGSGTRTSIPVWTEDFSGTLANWAVQSNSSSWAISAGKLVVSGTGVYGSYLIYTNWTTAFHSWTMRCQVTPLIVDSVSYGIGFGIRGMAVGASDRNFFLRLSTALGTTRGTVYVYSGTSNAPVIWGASGLGMSNVFNGDDPLDVTMQRRGQMWSLFVSNTVNNSVRLFTHSTSLGNTIVSGQEPQAGYFSFWAVGGTQTVDNVSFTVDPIVPVSHLVVGDSIASGAGASSLRDGFSAQLRATLGIGVQNFSAFGGTLDTVGAATNELNLLAPQKVLLMLGGNNIARADSEATWTSQYTNLVNCITNTAVVYHCYPTPRDATDVVPLVKFISTNYAQAFRIDTFGPLKGTNWNSQVLRDDLDSGDGLHPSSTGHAALADIIFQTITP